MRSPLKSYRVFPVTVVAPLATMEDALSTVFSVMAEEQIRICLKNFPSVKVRLTDTAGAVIMF
ncbi:MAG: hypothetical protein JKY59_06520 [Emcibacter sp.]|nr:hypothetical protein [Emcibacter sp.]